MRSEWGRFLSRLLASIDELNTPEMDYDDYPYSNPRNDVWDTQGRDADVKNDFLAFPKSASWTVDKFWLSSGG